MSNQQHRKMDLRGLENLRGVVDLQILCDSLESLQGLSLPTRMGDVTISGENLRDLGDLALDVVEDLDIRNTALENLDALSTLTITDHLTLSANPALTNLDGLNTLQESNGIRIIANPALERLPELDSLGYLRELVLLENERLVELPTFPRLVTIFERSASQRDPEFDREYFRLDSLQIEGSPALERLQLPGAWALTGLIQISDNTSLQSVALAQVEAADHITIENNPALAQVDVGTLRTVDELCVLNNPLLPLSDFDGLRTFESELSSGPAGSAEPRASSRQGLPLMRGRLVSPQRTLCWVSIDSLSPSNRKRWAAKPTAVEVKLFVTEYMTCGSRAW